MVHYSITSTEFAALLPTQYPGINYPEEAEQCDISNPITLGCQSISSVSNKTSHRYSNTFKHISVGIFHLGCISFRNSGIPQVFLPLLNNVPSRGTPVRHLMLCKNLC